MGNTSLKTTIISSLDNSDKKIQSSSILLKEQLASSTKKVNIAMIDANTYHAACYWKRAQVFAVSLKDLQYQIKKEAKAENNPKSIILEDYHNFLDIFSKKNSNILLSY